MTSLIQRRMAASRRARPAPNVNPSYPTEYANWLAEVILTADWHGDQWVDTTYTVDDGAVVFGQYEPWYGFRKLAAHIGGDSELEAQAVAAGDAWRDGYADPNSYAVPGYYNYTSGFALDYVLNADTDSQDAVIGLSESAAFAADATGIDIGGTDSDLFREALSREAAYAIISYINAEVYCGESHRSRMEVLIDLILGDVDDEVTWVQTVSLTSGGHIEQWLGDYTTDSSGDYVSGTTEFATTDYAPFMGAITARALILYYELRASINGGTSIDTRTIPKLTRLADATWNEAWGTANGAPSEDSFFYRLSSLDGGGDPRVLNGMIFNYFAWLYYRTGEARFKTRANLIFNSMMNCGSLVYRGPTTGLASPSKEFNQIIRWTFDGLGYYAAGVAAHG